MAASRPRDKPPPRYLVFFSFLVRPFVCLRSCAQTNVWGGQDETTLFRCRARGVAEHTHGRRCQAVVSEKVRKSYPACERRRRRAAASSACVGTSLFLPKTAVSSRHLFIVFAVERAPAAHVCKADAVQSRYPQWYSRCASFSSSGAGLVPARSPRPPRRPQTFRLQQVSASRKQGTMRCR